MQEFIVSADLPPASDQTEVDRIVGEVRAGLAEKAAAAGVELDDAFELTMSASTDLQRSERVITGTAHAKPPEKPPWPTVLVDFDGVLHAYSKGWHDGTVYDGPMPGAQEALTVIEGAGYTVVVFSTRPADQIAAAFELWGWPPRRITDRKLPALAIIDDRAIPFFNWAQAYSELIHSYPPVRTR